MAYCPVCKIEYRDGYTRCAECGVRLTPSLPSEKSIKPPPEFVYLKNVPDGPLGETFIAKLRAYDIPYSTKLSDSGALSSIYTGRSVSGMDIYIPKDYLEFARAVLFSRGVETAPEGGNDLPEIELVKLSEKDVYEACEVYNLCTVDSQSSDSVRSIYLDNPESHPAFAIKTAEELIGIAALRQCDDEQVGAACDLQILIRPELFAISIVSLALSGLTAAARKAGYRIILVMVPDSDDELIGFYKKNGFVPDNEQVYHTENGQKIKQARLLKNIGNE